MDRNALLIGDVAKRSGASRKAVRLYEARGILPPARRTASGYRVYSSEVLGILAFVEQGRRLGLTLAELGHIVALRRAGAAPCTHVRRLLEQRAVDLAGLLAAVRRILRTWATENGRPAAVCPHIEGKGGEITWKSSLSRSARPANTVRKSSSKATR
jgi:MerR family transcriptional regulator, copper efflux regulator